MTAPVQTATWYETNPWGDLDIHALRVVRETEHCLFVLDGWRGADQETRKDKTTNTHRTREAAIAWLFSQAERNLEFAKTQVAYAEQKLVELHRRYP